MSEINSNENIISISDGIPLIHNVFKSNLRKCGECTKCCEGWLSGVAHGKSFYPGKPCHFKGCNGCTIYENRPENPCKTFSCFWLEDKEFNVPEWLKPSLSNVILSFHPWTDDKSESRVYLRVTECGVKMDPKVMWWAFEFAQQNRVPFGIQIDGGWNYYGDSEFINTVEKTSPTK